MRSGRRRGRDTGAPVPRLSRFARPEDAMTDAIATRPTIRTERLLLRPLTGADAPRLADLADDFEVVKMTGGMPFPYTLGDAERMVARAEAADPVKTPAFA